MDSNSFDDELNNILSKVDQNFENLLIRDDFDLQLPDHLETSLELEALSKIDFHNIADLLEQEAKQLNLSLEREGLFYSPIKGGQEDKLNITIDDIVDIHRDNGLLTTESTPSPSSRRNLFDLSPPSTPPQTMRRSARDSLMDDDLDLFSVKSPNSIHTISTEAFLKDMEPANLVFEDDPMKDPPKPEPPQLVKTPSQSLGLRAPGGLKPPSSLKISIPAPSSEQPVPLFKGLDDDEEPRVQAPAPISNTSKEEISVDTPAPQPQAASPLRMSKPGILQPTNLKSSPTANGTLKAPSSAPTTPTSVAKTSTTGGIVKPLTSSALRAPSPTSNAVTSPTSVPVKSPSTGIKPPTSTPPSGIVKPITSSSIKAPTSTTPPTTAKPKANLPQLSNATPSNLRTSAAKPADPPVATSVPTKMAPKTSIPAPGRSSGIPVVRSGIPKPGSR